MDTVNQSVVTAGLFTLMVRYGFEKSWRTSLITGVVALGAFYALERVFYHAAPPANSASIAVGMEKIPANGSGPGLTATA